MEPLSKKRVLITGAEGFTGQHLTSYLEDKDFDVIGTSLNSGRSKMIQLNIDDVENIRRVVKDTRPDFIVHLAAISFVNHPNSLDFYRINTLGTENLLKSLIDVSHVPQKILIPSSATIYGNQGVTVLDESMVPKPANHYGCSKLAMERIVFNYFERLPLLISRPFNYTGPRQGDNFLIPKLVNHFKNREDVIELGNIDVKREFNSIDFLCEVYFRLLMSDVHSQILNVCSSITYSITEILNELEQLARHQIEIKVNPKFVRKNEIFELRGSTSLLSTFIQIPESKPICDTLKDMLEN
ncbi:NAD-dependent epimerase/dehydratase family protein [Ekhidna sp.]|uniref:NAD-dependent epimerase/dehydratase family protein n=1 Tax=Ekhidna sp. TaxID=2608089 RepID=UPI003B5123EE